MLFALGIPHVGGENAELLVRRFGSVAALRAASVEEISETPGIGPVIAESVWEYFRDPRNLALLSRLEGLDLAPAITELTHLEQLYQATLASSARLMQLSLLDFLR